MVRRLAAIVAVDIVGFSRLMALDEDATWQDLNELRALIDPILETEGGRVVKSTGDGVLVEAPSVIGAVRAAIEVQEAVETWHRNRPEDRILRLRIGINVGDIIVAEDGDVYGDGVNVAARLEGLAEPGGICISESAYQQVRGRIDALFVDLGDQRVKNIPTPVRVWAIRPGVGTGGIRVAHTEDQSTAGPTRTTLFVTAVAVAALVIGGAAYGILTGETPPTESTVITADTTPTSGVQGGAEDATFVVEGAVWVTRLPADVVDIAGDDDRCGAASPCPLIGAVLLADGTIVGLGVQDGSDSWNDAFEIGVTTPITDTDGFRASTDLKVEGGRVSFVRSGSRFLYSVDLRDGSQEWRTLTPFASAVGGPRLAATGEDVYVGFGLGLARLDDGGRPTWENPAATTLPITDVSADLTLVTAIDGRSAYRFDPNTGTRIWELGPPGISGPTWILAQEIEISAGTGRSFDRRVLVVTERGQMLALDGDTRAERWTAEISLPPGSAPNDRAFVTGVDGEPMSLWMDTGTVDWVNPDLSIDRPLVAKDGRVHGIVGNELVTLNDRSGTVIGRIRLPDIPTTDPEVIGDVVLIGIGSLLVAVPAGG